ncbi:sigma-70 family RNA polymerase sigma factor [Actinoplanes sp. NPDC051343]|jgi:RNA polymerase sigma-70 factor (ECF subfamily)|uniref:sigma-70 family RNA polymerase sigma factor n=1 Tax=Actinoplanes sp. NPDC051343 TaxID=3363906 RepID=UPI003795DE45
MVELHAEHRSALLRFLIGLTGGEWYAAEDLVQETMIRAWRSLESVPADSHGSRRWLLTVARRVAIDSARRRQARPAEAGPVDAERIASVDDTTEIVVLADSWRNAVHRLSDTHRTILSELYFQGRSLDETARTLGIPLGTVKSRAHYAVRSLREAVAG